MRTLFWFCITLTTLYSKALTLTPEQEKDWQLTTEQPVSATELTVGTFMAQVITPPSYLYAVTLPFEAQVKHVHVAPFQEVTADQELATVSSQTWIEAQQSFINDTISYEHQLHESQRKNQLCQEEIIPKKDCTEAEHKRERFASQLGSSRALLIAYGATSEIIKTLEETSRIQPTLPILSPDNGTVTKLNIHSGKTVTPSTPLMVIQKKGSLWLEVDMPVTQASFLTKGQHVTIVFNNARFETQVLLHAPMINPDNQTQTVRFKLPKEEKLLSGFKAEVTLYTKVATLKVAKKSVVTQEKQNMVFIKTAQGYEPTTVTVLGEDNDSYYLIDQAPLHQPIVTSSIAILKSMMESEDE